MRMPIAVDVISVCNASGEIQPLRLRLEDWDSQMIRVNIEEVVSTRQVEYVGVESQIFTCRAKIGGQMRQFELKYMFRSHRWYLCQQIY